MSFFTQLIDSKLGYSLTLILGLVFWVFGLHPANGSSWVLGTGCDVMRMH